MAYVSVPNDLSKVKTKLAFNLTKRQLICFGAAAVIGIPAYLFTRTAIGNTGAMLLMISFMLPCFFFAMYERDGLPFEKVVRNIVRSKFLWPSTRPYRTQNIYAYLSSPRKEVQQIGTKNKMPARSRKKRKV
ncbi:PrgI family protein [Scatolibacter rhodanostii]|uniref:PrgI family protein n=1 Tax=Scatolibacter rhodanostii TaxID=2014781 RepID=UPI000C0817CF|nr:PrgI family protein [Scatolibacter rhodanostii]